MESEVHACRRPLEKRIREIAKSDRSTAIILAAVHFEWMLKRTLLMLGSSPTKGLRQQFESIYSMTGKNGHDGYKELWARESKANSRTPLSAQYLEDCSDYRLTL